MVASHPLGPCPRRAGLLAYSFSTVLLIVQVGTCWSSLQLFACYLFRLDRLLLARLALAGFHRIADGFSPKKP
ncbi:hypothetical protein GE09DRAFT_1124244, partial [Coniochaeta sp. 2T2.1]